VLSEPTLSADALLQQLQGRFAQLCQDVAAAVNRAPAGQVINASEEQVRDLLADFRQATYQTALQLRTDAAQAAFPPSAPPAHGNAPTEQGPR
jgi:Rod binding domain-containing protein